MGTVFWGLTSPTFTVESALRTQLLVRKPKIRSVDPPRTSGTECSYNLPYLIWHVSVFPPGNFCALFGLRTSAKMSILLERGAILRPLGFMMVIMPITMFIMMAALTIMMATLIIMMAMVGLMMAMLGLMMAMLGLKMVVMMGPIGHHDGQPDPQHEHLEVQDGGPKAQDGDLEVQDVDLESKMFIMMGPCSS